MNCPRCEIGTISKAKMKKDGSAILLCEYCGSIWFSDESPRLDNGHFLSSYSNSEDREYTLNASDDVDQEHQPADNREFR